MDNTLGIIYGYIVGFIVWSTLWSIIVMGIISLIPGRNEHRIKIDFKQHD
jgi:hypothetical protein